MKFSNQLLKTQLERNLEGLGRAFGFNGEIKPYFWEISEQGDLTADKLLLENKIWDYPHILQAISLAEYNDWLVYRAKSYGEVHERIHTLTQLLESNLVDFQIYRAYYPDEPFCLYIGQIDENWFGLSETFAESFTINLHPDIYRKTSDRFLIPDLIDCDRLTNSLTEKLVNSNFSITRDFNCINGVYMWALAETKSLLIEKLLTLSRFLSRFEFNGIEDLYDSIRMSCSTEILEEYGLTEKYRELERYLTQDLNDPQVFVVGPFSNSLFDIYILGRDRDNDWAGVQIEVRLLS